MNNNHSLNSLRPNNALLTKTFVAAAGLALASSAFMAPSAQAFSLSINPQYGTTNGIGTGATAELDFSFMDTLAGVVLNLAINNTTDGTVGMGATQATLVGVAFDLLGGVSAAQSGYNANGSAFTKYYSNPSIPGLNNNNPFSVGILSAGSGNFVGGNPNQGLRAGEFTNVSFLLGGTTGSATSVETSFQNAYASGALKAAARFQQVNAGGGSDKVLGGGVQAVPEPTTMGGLALGFGALMKWRSQRKNQKQ